MLDPKLLRSDFETISLALKRKHIVIEDSAYQALEEKRKVIQTETEALQAKSKRLAKDISGVAADDRKSLLEQGAALKQELEKKNRELATVQTDLESILSGLPNLPHDSVPDGKDKNDNVEVRRWGEPPSFSFAPLSHADIAAQLKLLDIPTATQIAGTRFMLLYGELAQMHRALAQFMLDIHTQKNGYREVYVPYIVNADSLYGTGQLPKFAEDLFKLDQSHNYLIPTAEVPLTNICRNQILDAANLPIKLVAHTPCFRSEAGSYGKDTYGIIRQHQFDKVELVQIVKAQESWTALESLTADAEMILHELELPYRVVALCGGDLGFSAAKTYDIEVWIPSENKYREISSCSNMTDFQARRMKTRMRNSDTNKTEWVHTLNGSALAVGRALAAIIENYQTDNGSVKVPQVLQSYMGGRQMIIGGE